MIRPIDIRLNAAHPDYPLAEAVTFTGSPSTVLIRGVPPNCGRWAITAVSVAATFPDGSTTTRAAVQSANGVWVATLPGTATSGRTTDGFRVIADGIDENGEAATGYILAVADFAVASLDVTPAPEPGETSYQMLYFDEVPSVLRKGDVAKVDGVLKFYNGTAWEAFATPPTLDDAVTRTSANGVKSSGIWSAIWGALSALPTGFTSLYDWVVDRLSGKLDASNGVATGLVVAFGNYGIRWDSRSSTEYAMSLVYRPNASLSWAAIRTFYIPQATTGNLALIEQVVSKAIEAIAPEFSILYSYKVGQLVRKDGILYICTTAHPSATQWDPSHFSADATVESALAVIRAAIPVASTSTPLMDGTGSAGSSAAFARGDHVHPKDTSKLDKSGGGIAKIEWVNSGQSTATLLITFANGKTLAFDYDGYSSDTVATREWIAAQDFIKSLTSYFTAGNLAQLTQDGGIADSTIPAASVAKKGEIRYDRITITTGQLQDHAVQKVVLNAATTTITLPALTNLTGKVSDFGIDMVNGYEVSGTPTAASFSLDGTLGTDYNIIVPEGEDWSEMSALAAGEMAQFYFTLSAFAINDKPTWKIVKQVVELYTPATVTP